MLKTIVLDDEKAIVESTCHFLKQLPFISLKCAETNPVTCESFIESIQPDVAILDIDMPEINGIEFAKIVAEKSSDTRIIFVTSHDGFVKDAFNVYAYDFIEKPIDYSRLEQTLRRLNSQIGEEGERLSIHVDDLEMIIDLSEVYMIEAQRKHSLIYLKDDIITVKEPLKWFEASIKSASFFKSSRSFMINLNYVLSVEKFSRTSLNILFKDVDFCGQLSKNLYADFKSAIDVI